MHMKYQVLAALMLFAGINVFAQHIPTVSSGKIERIEHFSSKHIAARNVDVWATPVKTSSERTAGSPYCAKNTASCIDRCSSCNDANGNGITDLESSVGLGANLRKRQLAVDVTIQKRKVLSIRLEAFDCPACQRLLDGTLPFGVGQSCHFLLSKH